jgi:DNA-binding IclR family transcriptional regulator
MTESSSGISTLNRVCSLLNAFSEEETILSMTEISKRIQLPKSTTFRMLEALEAHGLILRDPQGRGYQLGYQLIRWGTLALTNLDLRNLAFPILKSLSAATDETAVLSIRYGYFAMWLDMVESPHPVRLAIRIREPLSLHAGASSKVLLAFLPETEIERLMSGIIFTQLKPNTITTPETMRNEIREIRSRGYATSFEETDLGAMGIAAPAYNHNGQPTAGIGIAAPISRVPIERVPLLAKFVLDASKELSLRLGAPVKRLPFQDS